jgi:CRP/FNR family transcriptional regulator, cyclic AMP receptor protein
MSTHRPVAAMLGRTILFKSLAERDRQLVARQMVAAAFAPEQLIFARGDPPDDIYLVLKGRVRLSVFSLDGRMLSFKHAEPGDTFGEIGPLDGGARTADATALTQVEVMSLERAKLNALLEGNPRVARAAIKFLCARLRETSELAEGIALHSIEMRLARFLLSALKRQHGDGPAIHAFIELGITQGELALLIGASRQKVNAALNTLEQAGAIRRTRTRLFCDEASLLRVAALEQG